MGAELVSSKPVVSGESLEPDEIGAEEAVTVTV